MKILFHLKWSIEDNCYLIRHKKTGITTHGKDVSEAITMMAEALSLRLEVEADDAIRKLLGKGKKHEGIIK